MPLRLWGCYIFLLYGQFRETKGLYTYREAKAIYNLE
uniref:Uncharacterized protein n=1 Tax=Arundo donax TaxID=35708 RepID=A0A0A9GY69_ARUDO